MTGDDYEELKSRLAEQAQADDNWMHAQVDLECCNPMCGLAIHAGEPIVYDGTGYCHPLCDIEHALDMAAEHRGDVEREA